MAAPRYYAGEIALGGLMQTTSAFGRVQDALSFFVDSYSSIAELAAVIQRLAGFTEHMEDTAQVKSGIMRLENHTGTLELAGLSVALPDGTPLLTDCTLMLPRGSRVLVTGVSGAGKSTLLRSLAGIWPYGSGTIRLPQDERRLFLPQRPYLMLGSLRRALSYPNTASEPTERITQILQSVGLSHIAARLDEVDDWSRILSLGEQQRLAFARILLIRPDWVFLDEATSALDEPREREMYELLRQELPTMSIISVGHRSTLLSVHDTVLHLNHGTFTYQEIQHDS